MREQPERGFHQDTCPAKEKIRGCFQPRYQIHRAIRHRVGKPGLRKALIALSQSLYPWALLSLALAAASD